ncbi:MAG: prepilin peptidase [Patescibacteria group bacterium]
MTLLLTIIFFGLGLIIGSFLNVVILRFNTNCTFGGRSGCLSCRHILGWRELIPVLSFLFLKGRCRHCKTRISWQYPLVEFVTGGMFALVFLKFQDTFYLSTLDFSVSYAYYVTMFSLLLVMAVYDLRHKIIPDSLVLFFGVFAFLGLFFFSGYHLDPNIPPLTEFISGVVLALPFALLWLLSRGEWMGLGDAKLAIGIGWVIGFAKIATGAVMAFWSGAIVGILLLLFSKKYKAKSELPFAPFLALGAFIAFMLQSGIFSALPSGF